MSNERIDLKQFEGMTKGPWKHVMPDHGWDDIMGANGELVSQVTLDNHIDGPSIAKLPTLIAELHRCYEKLDMAESALTEIWAYQIDNVGGYNVTEILLYYKKAHGLNIRPDASE